MKKINNNTGCREGLMVTARLLLSPRQLTLVEVIIINSAVRKDRNLKFFFKGDSWSGCCGGPKHSGDDLDHDFLFGIRSFFPQNSFLSNDVAILLI